MTESPKQFEPGMVPAHVADWPLHMIVAALSRPLPAQMIKTLPGRKIRYIPWYSAAKILHKYAPGWKWEFTYDVHDFRTERKGQEGMSGDMIVIGTLTILAKDGTFSMQSSGVEDTDDPAMYGSHVHNAEANAFKRCCAKFGLGLYLYRK